MSFLEVLDSALSDRFLRLLGAVTGLLIATNAAMSIGIRLFPATAEEEVATVVSFSVVTGLLGLICVRGLAAIFRSREDY